MMPKSIRLALHTCALALAFALPAGLHAQTDTIPRFVTGQIDWTKVRAMAPKFQQKDLVVRVVRLNNITKAFEGQGNAAWQDDWHFLEITGDRHLDGIYSGANKHHQGWYTYMCFGDTAYKYPIVFQAPGYVHSLKYDSSGIEMILRDDPGEKEYITEISHYYYDQEKDTATSFWKMRFVSTTEIPVLGPQPDQHKLLMPMTLRTSAREVTEPAIDYDQDGRPDGAGNAVAEFAAGARLRRYAVTRQGDLEWSFVTFLDPPAATSVLKPAKEKGVVYAGWIPSGAFKR